MSGWSNFGSTLTDILAGAGGALANNPQPYQSDHDCGVWRPEPERGG